MTVTNDTGKPDDAAPAGADEPASPPCYGHEVDPALKSGESRLTDADRIRNWRRTLRNRLRDERDALSAPELGQRTASLVAGLEQSGVLARHERIGFYWPLGAEPDLRALMAGLADGGKTIALPVIVERNAPLEFWRWRPGDVLSTEGLWGIPAPATRDVVRVTLLLVPLLGFDADNHRLGYGGGYYDRTLAALEPRPETVGIGFELGRIDTIYPQPHDMAMDRIVTDVGQQSASSARASSVRTGKRRSGRRGE